MALPKKPKRSPAEGELPFDYDWEPAEEVLTAYAGLPLFVRTMRSLAVPASVNRHLRIKRRDRGLDEASLVESFLALNALGGECLDDFERLREDVGLAEMVGHDMPTPKVARSFLYAFHDEGRIEAAQQEPLPVAQRAFQALPETVEEFYFRGDSACWEKSLVKWLRDPERAEGPGGAITFAISVRMTPTLKKHIRRIPDPLWKPYREDAEAVSECADLLNYWPEEEDRPEGAGPLRCVAIRIRKRLRFHFFCSPGKLVHHARRVLARVARRAAELLEWAEAWRLLPLPG